MKMYEFGLKFHLSLFLGAQLTIYHQNIPENGLAQTRRQAFIWTNDG